MFLNICSVPELCLSLYLFLYFYHYLRLFLYPSPFRSYDCCLKERAIDNMSATSSISCTSVAFRSCERP